MTPDPSRRTLLGGLAAAALAASTRPALGRGPVAPPAADPTAIMAADERFWRAVQEAFTLDRTVINLNNGGCSPTPRAVHEAFKRYLDWSNQGPPLYMWQQLEPGIEAVRRELALEAGCSPDELAITRNASESLQIAQLGIDLKAGDEIVTTDQDYPRMINTWAQRARREGVTLRRVSFPVPATHAELVRRVGEALTPATRVLHICHITNLTGQILPVRELCDLARQRGVISIVDGAHAFGQWPFRLDELGCDYYGTSLHKWLLAPVGTGFLYVARDRIPRTWALQPGGVGQDADIRKFEEIGTHPAANHHAISEALLFHRGVGAHLKAARLRLLRARWTDALRGRPRVQLLTSDDPATSCGIGTVGVEGMEPGDITAALWSRARIVATPIRHAPADPTDAQATPGPVQFSGVRVTPNIYTTLDEIDRFTDAMLQICA